MSASHRGSEIDNPRRDPVERKNFLVPEKEMYTCGNCGQPVEGGRYNNHCPSCLWSKHVDDKIPGDRASTCQGLMKPIGILQKKGNFRIQQECTSCGKVGVVDASPADNRDVIINLSTLPVRK